MFVDVQLDGSERAIPFSELEERIRDGSVGPETPVREANLTGGRWTPAGELAVYRGLRASPEVALRRLWARPAFPWMTAVIVGVLARVYTWTHWTRFEEPLQGGGALSTASLIEGDDFWRLVTYGLFHADFAHITMNLLFLAYVGVAIERVVGPWHLLGLFVGGVFWGGVVSAFASPDSAVIGASGADFAYLAAAAAFGLRYHELLPRRARPTFGFVILVYVIWMFLNGALSDRPVANWGHLGGLVFGALAGTLLRPDLPGAWRAQNLRFTLISVVAAVAAVVGVARVPVPLVPIEEDGLRAPRPLWWTAGWAVTGESGWVSPLDAGVVVARTTHEDRPTTPAEAEEHLLAAYREVDPLLQVREESDITVDGVKGRRLLLAYERDGAVRRVDAEVFARGRYVHRVLLDTPLAPGRIGRLGGRIFAGVHLDVPEAVATARQEGPGWRGALRRAEGEADVGEVDAARRLVDEARTAAPREPAPVVAFLHLLADYPTPDLPARVEEAFAAFPHDQRVLEAGLRALVASGHEDDARQRLDTLLSDPLSDRRLRRLRDELFPAADSAQAAPPEDSPTDVGEVNSGE